MALPGYNVPLGIFGNPVGGSPNIANVSTTAGAPTDWQAQQAEIARRQALAQQLMQSGMEPDGGTQMAGPVAIQRSWTEGLAKALKTGVGAYQQNKAIEDQKALAGQYQGAQNADAGLLAQALRGTPATPEATVAPDGLPMTQPAQPAAPATGITPDMIGKLQTPGYRDMLVKMLMDQATKAGEPYTLAPGAGRYQNGVRVAEQNKPVEPFTLNAGDTRYGADGKPIVAAPAKNADAWGEPYPMNGVLVQRNSQTGEVKTAVTREPQIHISNPAPVTPVTIADPSDPTGMGTIVVDGRTQQVIGKGPKLTQAGGADQKLALQKPQATLRVNSMTQNFDRLDTALQELNDDPGLSHITGSIAGRTPNLLNSATGAQAKLNSVKSQIFQESLQAMREASKTGGAVGNVSDREGDKLERTLSALDQAQGTKDFQVQLKKAQAQIRLSRQLIQQAYDEQFGGVQSSPTGGPPSPKGASGAWSVVR